jgi:hypothetical protein
MTRSRLTASLLVLYVAASGCSNPVASGPVEIRVENASAASMEDVRIGFPDAWVDYGTLDPGEVTAYQTVALAYRVASVEATIDGEVQRLQVIDFVGEQPLSRGRYTYRLDLFDGVSLIMELVEE